MSLSRNNNSNKSATLTKAPSKQPSLLSSGTRSDNLSAISKKLPMSPGSAAGTILNSAHSQPEPSAGE